MIQSLVRLQECSNQRGKGANHVALHSIHERFEVQNSHSTNGKARNIESTHIRVFQPGSRITTNGSVNYNDADFTQIRSKAMRKESKRFDEVINEATSPSKHIRSKT